MDTLYKSESGLTTIKGRAPETTFWGYILLMLREAIEPIALALGISLLYTRFESVSNTVSQTKQSLWSAIYADSEAHPMIYFALAIVFIAWIFYKAWKLKDERIRDRELKADNSEIKNTLAEMNTTLKSISSILEKRSKNG